MELGEHGRGDTQLLPRLPRRRRQALQVSVGVTFLPPWSRRREADISPLRPENNHQ